jgi:hypothetical protein
MAKKQTRRSVSVSKTTYERLKAYCEVNNVSMSEFIETRIGDFLGRGSKDKDQKIEDKARKVAGHIFTF